MNEIAQKIRQKRFEAGSISFERTKPRFKLDETNYPVGFQEDVRKDSNCMVEEYMLLANQFVGKFIIDTCSEVGVLRCHPPPSQAKVAIVENILKKLNLTMDFNSSKTIHDSFQKIIKDQAVPAAHRTVNN
jgi:exoribonuclease R